MAEQLIDISIRVAVETNKQTCRATFTTLDELVEWWNAHSDLGLPEYELVADSVPISPPSPAETPNRAWIECPKCRKRQSYHGMEKCAYCDHEAPWPGFFVLKPKGAPTETQTATPEPLPTCIHGYVIGENGCPLCALASISGSPRAAQPATTEPNKTQKIAQELLHGIGQTRQANRFTTTLCWNTAQLENLAMFAISAKNELASRPPSPSRDQTPEPE